mgnify:FL=1|tara:strand:+ start:18790 stop:19506 length:717 start_codon:yes stop_codon:yes gene_type:complete
MIIYFRNYFRNKTLNLTVKSVRYFMPNAEINCVCFYDKDVSEYDNFEKICGVDNIIYKKTSYPNDTNISPEISNNQKTSGSLGSRNLKIFTEGYNTIFSEVKNRDEKVLLLTEDHFFTNGKTLKELLNSDFSLAYARFGKGVHTIKQNDRFLPNASIICFLPKKIKHLFPLNLVTTKNSKDPWSNAIEYHLKKILIDRVKLNELHIISTRNHANYMGDGLLTNDYLDIENRLKNCDII